MKKELV